MDKILYKRNFLKNVIFRLDFIVDEKIFEQMMQKRNIDLLKTRFEILEPLQTVKNTNFMINVDNHTMEHQDKESKKYILKKKNQSAILIIQPNALVVDYSSYENAEMLKEDIKVLNTVFSNVSISRVGLRYVNYLECSKFGDINWNLYITDNLLNHQTIKHNGTLLQSITVTDIKYDNFIIRFQHGIHNQNQPSDRIKDAFVLDFDAYTNNFGSDENLEDAIEKWNEQIDYLFEKSITNEFRDVLNDPESELQLK